MRKNFSLGMEKTWKENNTPVTISDTTINRFVIEAVNKDFPSHGILGEEESDLKESEYVWVCDPLDGTIPFAHGIPLSTFSLALTQEGAPILGVIYDPYMDRLFVAEKGKGAYLNDKKIKVSDRGLQNNTLTIEGSNRYPPFNNVRMELSNQGTKILSMMAFVYSGMLVSAGELVAAVFAHKNPWDVAAVKIIVEEAGGKCTDIEGNDQRYDRETNGFIASNGVVHEQLVDLLKKYEAKSH
jgi:fructose-1,6-bisphosphatase/inositol monophosphatase family enzyme